MPGGFFFGTGRPQDKKRALRRTAGRAQRLRLGAFFCVHNPQPTMNRLASILPPAQVLVRVDATSKKRAFEEAGLLFESLHGLSREQASAACKYFNNCMAISPRAF